MWGRISNRPGEPVRDIHARDIDDLAILRIIDDLSHDDRWSHTHTRWVMWPEVTALLPEYPAKVVHAKIRRLMTRSLLDGCPCGCRGDLELTAAGRGMLDTNPLTCQCVGIA